MNQAFNNYRILVAEEFCLINYEIKLLLKKQGFHVIEAPGESGFLDTLKNQSPDFIITCLASLNKATDKEHVLKTLLLSNDNDTTDTIIFDGQMNALMKYPKPYNAHDMINYIIDHLTVNK